MKESIQDKLKTILYLIIIINEWIVCGEFEKADKIVFVGNKSQAIVINFLFWKSKKEVYYCMDFRKKYKYNARTKWIIFNHERRNERKLNSYDILVVPQL